MKKQNSILLFIGLLAPCATVSLSAQTLGTVGINNASPQATLDVSPKNASDTKTPEGIIAPRLTGLQLDNKTIDASVPYAGTVASAATLKQIGAIVYVYDVSGANAPQSSDPRMVNVTSTGYYYWDGGAWQKNATGGNLASSAWVLGGNVDPASNILGLKSLSSATKTAVATTPEYMTTQTTPGVFDNAWTPQDVVLVTVANNITKPAIVISPDRQAPATVTPDVTVGGLHVGNGGYARAASTVTVNAPDPTNTVVGGGNSLSANKSGTGLTAFGYNVLSSNTTGFENVAIGHDILPLSTAGSNNLAIGSKILTQVDGSQLDVHQNPSPDSNIGIGISLFTGANYTGANNLAMGSFIFNADGMTGEDNIVLGLNAMSNNTTGSNNIGLGNGTLAGNVQGAYNIGFGKSALAANTGDVNDANVGSYNIAMGDAAMSNIDQGQSNIAIGANALNNAATTTGLTYLSNIAIGRAAMGLTGDFSEYNVALGDSTLAYLNAQTGHNVAIGHQAGLNAVNSSGAVYVGYYAGVNVGGSAVLAGAADHNTCIGALAGAGSDGLSDGVSNTTVKISLGIENVALGYAAGLYNVGQANTFLGSRTGNQDGSTATPGDYNIFVGYDTGGLMTGNNNIAIGNLAGATSGTTATGVGNILLGTNAGNDLTTGGGNVIIGAINHIDNQANTVIIGTGGDAIYNTANGDEIMRMASKLVTTGGTPNGVAVSIGYSPTVAGAGDNFKATNPFPATVFDGTYAFDVNGATHATGNIVSDASVISSQNIMTSDIRLKTNIKDLPYGTDLLMKLRPVIYDKKASMTAKDYKFKNEMGFIAQEIRKVLPNVVVEGQDKDKTLAVNYTELIPVLTKALQEQEKRAEVQDAKIKAQDAKIEALTKLVEQLTKKP